MVKFNIDDYITEKLLNIPLLNNIFKNIHPNIISISGLISVLILNHIYFDNNLSIYKTKEIFAILLFIKYITDTLDGGVARKYKKMSKLGNFLDTLADNTFQFLVLTILLSKFKIPHYYSIYIFLLLLVLINYFNVLQNHNFVKKDNLLGIITANSYLTYFIIYIYLNKDFLTT